MELKLEAFEAARRADFVTRSVRHDLVLYCYHPRVGYEDLWDDPQHGATARAARGIIFSTQGEIVARPLPKFFNLSERPESDLRRLVGKPHLFEEKVDGSLGIVYHHRGAWDISTKGSFHSEQAQWARKNLLPRLNARALQEISPDLTLLFEIVYPENRIVVDYGSRQELVLLTALNRISGREVKPAVRAAMAQALGCRAVKLFPHTLSNFQHEAGTEGYVVRFTDGSRVKIKEPEYVLIHRMLQNLAPRLVMEDVLEGHVEEKSARMPAQLAARYQKLAGELYLKVQLEVERAQSALLHAKIASKKELQVLGAAGADVLGPDPKRARRAALAAELEKLEPDTRALCWALHDGKRADRIAARRIIERQATTEDERTS